MAHCEPALLGVTPTNTELATYTAGAVAKCKLQGYLFEIQKKNPAAVKALPNQQLALQGESRECKV